MGTCGFPDVGGQHRQDDDFVDTVEEEHRIQAEAPPPDRDLDVESDLRLTEVVWFRLQGILIRFRRSLLVGWWLVSGLFCCGSQSCALVRIAEGGRDTKE